MAAERLEAELSVHKDYSIARLKEVLGGRCTSSTWPDHPQSFRRVTLWMACEVDPPALKLSRKRTLSQM